MDLSSQDGAIPDPEGVRLRGARWGRSRDLASLVAVWGVWLALTVILLFYIRHYSRNMPFWDDFSLVPMMTGTQPVSMSWAWEQHNEHRPLISRLVIAGLVRFVANDFRAARYTNVILLSAMAAAMLMLARRLRGSARLVDAVLPLAILNYGQSESVLIGFAMNLVLTSMLAVASIVVVCQSRRWSSTSTALGFGAILFLLPLSGGSGLAMLPPLAVWLAGYIGWEWWSGRAPALATRATGLILLVASLAIAVFYFQGYRKPPHHPLPPSPILVADATVKYLSLAVCPRIESYWWPASLIVVVLLVATLVLLGTVAIRSREERPRALGLVAVIASMLAVAVAVGIGRSGLSSTATLASRYITLAAPLGCALYVSWLIYGGRRDRTAVLALLLVMACAALPDCYRWSRWYGWHSRISQHRVERTLTDRVAHPPLTDETILGIFPDPVVARQLFQMLKRARMGNFVHYDDAQIAKAAPDSGSPAAAIRR